MNHLLAVLALLALLVSCSALQESPGDSRPNIVLILADDLGYNEVGCYGQERIRTPNLDRLAAGGMRFTQHYSGSPVCAPSRCVLMTGKHTGNSYVRGNTEVGGWGPDEPEGQLPLPEDTATLARLLQGRGYATCAVGKWGLGGPGSTGHPNHQGFDHFYGYLCQRVAHNYYPTHLWRNSDRDVLEGNEYFSAHQRRDEPPADPEGWREYEGAQYAPDRMIEEALAFVRNHRDDPFFLYLPTNVPHVAIQVPEDSLAEYSGAFDDQPYLGERGYLPHPEPRAGYAAMVTRMDRDIGRLLDLLDELELSKNTIVFFTSDNGPTFNGGTDSAFFESNRPFRGLKCSVWEGGIRVPMIARWPVRVEAGTTSDHVSGFQDFLPTLMEITKGDAPDDIDGISILPALLGRDDQPEHPYLYWEYPEVDGQQALRRGDWKAVRRDLKKEGGPLQLYDLSADPAEEHDVSAENPEIVKEISELLERARVPSAEFPLPALD